MERRITVDEANRMLPLVARIVRDIVMHYRRWQQAVTAFEVATADPKSPNVAARVDALHRETQLLARDIEGFIGELDELNIVFKDFERGLVDFPSERDGKPVYLCWRLGEPEVAFWHDEAAGFAGRQPIETGSIAPVPT